MCRFHKDVAERLSTNPDTQQKDPVRYAILITAFARFWIDRHLPTIAYCDGYSAYELSTPAARDAFTTSGLIYNPADDTKNDDIVIKLLDDFISRENISLESLGLPKNLIRRAFMLDNAYQYIYEGDPAYALNILPKATNNDYEALRLAVEKFFFTSPDLSGILERMIDHSIAKIFTQAPEKTNPSLLKAYDFIPQGLRKLFSDCAMCVRDGGASAGLSHAACLAVPAGAAMVGMGSAGIMPAMMSAMYVTSPALAAAATNIIDHRRTGSFSTWKRSAGSALIALGVAFGINQLYVHDHLNSPKAQWFESLDPTSQRAFQDENEKALRNFPPPLREKIEIAAKNQGIPAGVYLAICDGTDSLGAEINAFRSQTNLALRAK